LLAEDLRAFANPSIRRHGTQYHQRVGAQGEAILRQPPVERVLIGPRLLDKSRTVVDRIYTLGLLHRLDAQPKWANRAVREMLVVAAFKDWNPSHFLDVAEMTHGMAIGYDWFYDATRSSVRPSRGHRGKRFGRRRTNGTIVGQCRQTAGTMSAAAASPWARWRWPIANRAGQLARRSHPGICPKR
jgi:hypothetical protein